MVETVSNHTGLDDCSVFTGQFYREKDKIGLKSRYSVLTGYGFFRIFLTKNNKVKIRDTEIIRFRQVFGFIRVRFGLRFDCIL